MGRLVSYQSHKLYKVGSIPAFATKMKKAIIFDLDGVICDVNHRRYLAEENKWEEFYEGLVGDKPNEWALDLLGRFSSDADIEIFFVTGRPEKYRVKTKEWFDRHDIFILDDRLFMRGDEDSRPDYEVKQEIYEKNIKDKYRVLFAIDDRKQVADMWRRVGLVCLHCDEGNF